MVQSHCPKAQSVQVEIETIVLNGQTTTTSCSEVDFGTVQNNSFNVNYKITKPAAQALVGTVNLYYRENNSSVSYQLKSNEIFSGSWIDNNDGKEIFQFSLTGDLQASQIAVSDGFVRIEFEGYTSCNATLTKTLLPEFDISPSNVEVVCGSTAAKTFTVTNVNSSPGTIQYNWNVGNGWRRNGSIAPSTFTTSTNSITLTPFIFTPSDVRAIVTLDGTNYGAGTSMVDLSPLSTSASISGASAVCSPSVYTVDNLEPGLTVQDWASPSGSDATVSFDPLNPTSATVTPGNDNRRILLYAVIADACGQTEQINVQLEVGKTEYQTGMSIVGDENQAVNAYTQLSIANHVPRLYRWWIVKLNDQCQDENGLYPLGTKFPEFDVGNGNFADEIFTTSPNVYINWGTCKGDYVVNFAAANDCGTTGVDFLAVDVFDPYNGDPCSGRLAASPNPARDGEVTVERIPADPCDDGPTLPRNSSSKNYDSGSKGFMRVNGKSPTIQNKVEIVDLIGAVVFSKTYDTNRFKIKELERLTGTYILKVKPIDEPVLTKLLVLE